MTTHAMTDKVDALERQQTTTHVAVRNHQSFITTKVSLSDVVQELVFMLCMPIIWHLKG